MTNLFISVINMSITASYAALAVIAVRLLLKKAPKIFSYILWSVVLFRLVCPFSFSSALSFMNVVNTPKNYIPQNIGVMQQPTVDIGINGLNNLINKSLPSATPIASVNPMGIIMGIAAYVWLVFIGILLIYSLGSYFKTKSRVKYATLVRDNIFETDRILTPFVIGFIRPNIYIPSHIAPEELSYVLQHEQTHIKRLDYLIKLFAFFALILHWFNPLMWVCYFLMSKDMEMSCDESVMKSINGDIRKGYTNSLLSLSAKQSGILSPLAFSESNVRSRIRNILNYKKPAFGVVVVATVAVVALVIGLMANPEDILVDKPDERNGLSKVNTTIQTETGNISHNEISDFSIKVNGELISLKDWDSDVNLEKILGKPKSEGIEILQNADTHTGSYIKQLIYDGLEIDLFSPKQNGKSFWILKMVVNESRYITSKGIKIGDTIMEIKAAYPNLKTANDGRTDLNNCAYEIIDEQENNYIQFEVLEGKVKEIAIFHLIP